MKTEAAADSRQTNGCDECYADDTRSGTESQRRQLSRGCSPSIPLVVKASYHVVVGLGKV
ncbi:hypothetical protein E2C01_085221 [Portunus trituberculatus]|uniref:Uncharacterized protein n=1 Tax=Portunus trituberculatus TaxID=210409 RepID=A0A5B7J686_PORTR|nr:hypothetical protein [Portunus trituberculatus]